MGGMAWKITESTNHEQGIEDGRSSPDLEILGTIEMFRNDRDL
jgi:hypothetical protein